jgi:hypothetical protein
MAQDIAPGSTEAKQNAFLSGGLLPILYMVLAMVVLLSTPILNLFINYTITGGTWYQKFHPSLYVLLPVFSFLILTDLSRLKSKSVVFWFVWFSILATYAWASGNNNYFSVLVCLFVIPVMFSALTRYLTNDEVRKLFKFFVYLVVTNFALSIFEVWQQQTIFPSIQEQGHFRAVGFLGHPIANGTVSCIALIGLRYINLTVATRRVIIFALLLQIILCGVRSSLLLGGLVALVELFSRGQNESLGSSTISRVAVICAFAVGLPFAYASGAFERVIAHGLWDSSAASRVDIFGMFSIMSVQEFWHGTSNERAFYYTNYLENASIENAFVVSVVQCGVVFAVVLFLSLFLYFRKAILSSAQFALLFGTVLMATASFGAKNSVVFPLFFLSELVKRFGKSHDAETVGERDDN